MLDLSGKTALVTGASGGIGGAISHALARQGATVALSGRRIDDLDALANQVRGSSRVFPADLSDPRAGEHLVQSVVDAMGSLDILVLNAGMSRDNLTVRLSDDDWQRVLDVNLTAAFRIVRAALRGMMKRRWGRIVAISSIVACTGNAGQANYVAAKAGLIGMIKSIAQEVASRGITANIVAPGFIDTDMTAALPAERKAAILAAVPVGRAGTPDDVAAAAVFLASEEAAYVTGQTLHVNGGLAML